MKRRDVLKTIPLAGLSVSVPNSPEVTAPPVEVFKNGKSPQEQKHDLRLHSQTFLTPHERSTVTVLCDIIIPADAVSGSASQAGVPAFIEFMLKDLPQLQTPVRGGLQWLDNRCLKEFGKVFISCTPDERLWLVDRIAYPQKAAPEFSQGVAFFNQMRDLTASGFYTSKIGLKDIGYMGNTPHLWAGPPASELERLGVSFDSDVNYADKTN